jgi:hypothetical protein
MSIASRHRQTVHRNPRAAVLAERVQSVRQRLLAQCPTLPTGFVPNVIGDAAPFRIELTSDKGVTETREPISLKAEAYDAWRAMFKALTQPAPDEPAKAP